MENTGNNKKEENEETPPKAPCSMGVILDGNRRWARERDLPEFEGHRQGYENLKNLVRWSANAGVEYLVVYAFSTENWKRKEEEKKFLFNLFRRMLERDWEEMHKEGVRIMPVGRISDLPEDIQESTDSAMRKTKDNTGLVFAPALSYGGRAEILEAARRLLENEESAENITEERFEKHLWSGDIPDVDIIIRPGGEQRLSNFLTWKSVYSELFFTPTYWPDFSEEELYNIFREYARRERRMGK